MALIVFVFSQINNMGTANRFYPFPYEFSISR